MLGAFFDDSGTHDSSKLVVIGGCLGDEAQWNAFAVRWATLLANPLPGKPPLESFHLTECRAGDGQFEDYRQADKDRVTYLFRKIIVDTNLITFAAAVDKVAWNEIFVGPLADAMPSPLEACFSKCVDSVIALIRGRSPWEKVYLFFDQGTKLALEKWATFYRSQSNKYPEIGGVSFAPVSDVLALQAADMIATESYQFGLSSLQSGEKAVANPHFREFMTRDLSAGFIYGREQIEKAAQLLKKRLRSPM